MSHRIRPGEIVGQLRPSIWEQAAEALVELDEDVDLSQFDADVDRAVFTFGPQSEYAASCMSGHVLILSRPEMLSLFDADTVLDIEYGIAQEPPILPLGECYQCSVEQQRRDRLAA